MKYYHGSAKLFKVLKKNSWVTPYKQDALIFAVPWSSNELVNTESKDGRPPRKLEFKKDIPEDHSVYLYEFNGPVKKALTNTGKYYDWNYKTIKDLPVKLIKILPSWHKYLLIKNKYSHIINRVNYFIKITESILL